MVGGVYMVGRRKGDRTFYGWGTLGINLRSAIWIQGLTMGEGWRKGLSILISRGITTCKGVVHRQYT